MKVINLLWAVLFCLPVFSQKITYTEPERDDVANMNFEIIGKSNGNYLMYKGLRNDHYICVYDNNMKLKEKNKLSFIADKVINSDFINYPDRSYLIYQFQKRGIVYCMAATIDSLGNPVGEPIQLDTTAIGILTDNKIYNLEVSEDKQKVMLFKIQRRNDKFNYTTMLLNSRLQPIKKSRMILNYDERKEVLSDFILDNDGDFVFAQSTRVGFRDYFNAVELFIKKADVDSFLMVPVSINNLFLDEVKIKIDNFNKHYLLSCFYYTKKHGDVEGIFSYIWDKNSGTPLIQTAAQFSDSLKLEAKTDGPYRMAFNNFFIRNIIMKKDGGYLLAAEDYYAQSRSNSWNRMDYLYGTPNLYDNYYSSNYYNSYRWRNNYSRQQTRYYYQNIAVMSVNTAGRLDWTNVVHKDQFDDESDNSLSFQLVNLSGELHVIFNEIERRNKLLGDRTITPDGTIKRNPTLKGLDKGFEFMPRYAKQVSARQIIVPCMYRNYLCFAKIDF
ncbi:hypothetical protein BH09BAC2_BH09BAC2_21400 [soil metagenome]